ncbi:MAG: hypothetical protein ACXWC9_09920 [Pseudobdellovibrionaceae bacterium]
MLKLLSEKNIIRNALITIYILVVLGISATAKAEMTINPIFTEYQTSQSEMFVGEVAMTIDQEFYLILSETEFYKLESNVDLFDYNGQKVEVEAVKIMHLNGPAIGASSVDPLPGRSETAVAAPVLVVFQISGVAN